MGTYFSLPVFSDPGRRKRRTYQVRITQGGHARDLQLGMLERQILPLNVNH